ncbi:MAG: TIGR02452 family protein [Bacteroidales bacterium]|nr:TIGR02452 family protein [Bacteroidales bacterium]
MANNTIPSWDDIVWKEQFTTSQHPMNRIALKQLRQLVFFNTTQVVRAGRYISRSGQMVDPAFNESIWEQTRYYRTRFSPDIISRPYTNTVTVVQADTLFYAHKMQEELGEPVCVLNFASATHPGGGVQDGAAAQEEYLFRCSDYYRSLFQFVDFGMLYEVPRSSESYPMDRHFGGCYTPGATVFRDTESQGYALLDEPWKVNFIAVAAINRPTLHTVNGEERITDNLIPTVRDKMRTIFRIAIDNRQHNLVLGAFGCGAFANPPKHIAELFRETLAEPEFKGCFQHIAFAIKGGPKGGNYLPFKAVLA